MKIDSLSISDQLADAIAFLGEFVGTTLFCFFAFSGTTVASLPATSVTDSGATSTQGAVQPSPNTSSRESSLMLSDFLGSLDRLYLCGILTTSRM